MHVVLLSQYYAPDPAATAQVLSDLGGGLADAGHRVTAVCSRRGYADPSVVYPPRETIDGVEIHRTWTTGFGRARTVGRVLDYGTFLLGASRLLTFRAKPDVVISLSTPPIVAILGWALARSRGARSIYWVMNVYPELAIELGVLKRGAVVSRLFAALSRFVLTRSDEVVALGETMAELLRAGGARRVTTIHNWADGDAIRPLAPEQNELRSQFGWDGRCVVLYSDTLGLAHDFETLLDAAETLRQRDDILFAFVGGGSRRHEVEAEVARRGLTNVEFRGYVPRDNLGRSLTAGDIHLISLRERMPGLLVPSKIYGILAAGRPTIYVGPDEAEIADIVREGNCGKIVALRDGRGLADAIERYVDRPEERSADGERARELFDRRFTLRHGLDAFGRLLLQGDG